MEQRNRKNRPSYATRREWTLRQMMDANVYWMLKYIRKGDSDKAASKATESLRLAKILLGLQDLPRER